METSRKIWKKLSAIALSKNDPQKNKISRYQNFSLKDEMGLGKTVQSIAFLFFFFLMLIL